MANERDAPETKQEQIKLSDKIWAAVVVAIFVIVFLLIVIFDVL